MSPFDLLAIVSVLATVGAFVRIGYLLIRKRTAAAKKTATRLATFVATYAVTLIAVSLVSPGKELAIGDTRCFDEWCITVTTASLKPSIGDVRATGIFHVVTVRISSRSRGRRQREIDVCTYLTDSRGRRFDVSPMGQNALQRAGLAGEPVTSFVDPGGSFDSRLAFDVPQDATDVGFLKKSCGWLPNPIIGDPGSFLHRPTTVRLGTS
jgi:hypothetical protein